MEPLTLEFTVGCSPDHAFAVWATRTSMWWPHGHSVSGDPGLTVTFEPRPGGRIYERTPAGEEHRAAPLRDRNRRSWDGLLPHYARAAEAG
jgi:hypothetical protein